MAHSQNSTTPKALGKQVGNHIVEMVKGLLIQRQIMVQGLRDTSTGYTHHSKIYEEYTHEIERIDIFLRELAEKQVQVTDLQPSDAQSQDNSHSKAKG